MQEGRRFRMTVGGMFCVVAEYETVSRPDPECWGLFMSGCKW